MTWLNPWAWVGALTVALPILIHLLGRGHARAYRFPTLRFLEASRLLPTRRTRIHDGLLLLVRCAVLVVAAAALARPLLLTRERKQSLDRGLARAIVVDTNASMKRLTPLGTTALDSARKAARAMAANATVSVILEADHPSRDIAGANEWLARQRRRAELLVISDFPRDAIDSIDLARVNKEFGVTMHRVPVATATGTESHSTANGLEIVARAAITGDRTDAEWTARGLMPPSDAVVLLGADSDREAIRATQDAARTVSVPLPMDTARAVAIVFEKYPDAARLKSTTTSKFAAWMVDLLATLRADSIAIDSSGVSNARGRSRLVLFTALEPGTLGAARMVVAASRALSVATPVSEFDPEFMSDATLASMQRPASDDVASQSHAAGDNGPSDGRWLWLGVLLLLGVETALRRTHAPAAAALGQRSP